MDQTSVPDAIYGWQCGIAADLLEYIQDAWTEGDQVPVEWMARGWSVIGDSFLHRMRDVRYEIERVLNKLVRDAIPATRPRLPSNYAERAFVLASKVRPYLHDIRAESPRYLQTWGELGVEEEITILIEMFRAEAAATEVRQHEQKRQPVPVQTLPQSTPAETAHENVAFGAVDTVDDNPPAFDPKERDVILTLREMGQDLLHSYQAIETHSRQCRDPRDDSQTLTVTARTIGKKMKRLIQLGIVEPPEHMNAGTRLTTKGIRIANRIA